MTDDDLQVKAGDTFQHARYAEADGRPATCRIINVDDAFITYRVGVAGRLIRAQRATFHRNVLAR